jgi:hypothetical protein
LKSDHFDRRGEIIKTTNHVGAKAKQKEKKNR